MNDKRGERKSLGKKKRGNVGVGYIPNLKKKLISVSMS